MGRFVGEKVTNVSRVRGGGGQPVFYMQGMEIGHSHGFGCGFVGVWVWVRVRMCK